jgi:hypothetical protein
MLCGARSYVQRAEELPILEEFYRGSLTLLLDITTASNYRVESQDRMSLLRCHDGRLLALFGSSFSQERSVWALSVFCTHPSKTIYRFRHLPWF